MKRQPVSRKKINKLIDILSIYGVKITNEIKNVFKLSDQDIGIIFYSFVMGECEAYIIQLDTLLVPFIDSVHCFKPLPRVYVDKGAANAILRGAHLMSPGIVELDPFEQNKFVQINFGDTPIAIGLSLHKSSDIIKMNRGRVVRNLHYKGDKYWRSINEYLQRR